MRTILIILSSFIAINAYAQDTLKIQNSQEVNNQNKAANLSKIEEIVTYNAKILGYARHCNIDKGQAESFLSFFNNVISQIPLTKEDSQALENKFNLTTIQAAQGKLLPTGFSCDKFKIFFNDVSKEIKGER